MRMVYKWEKVKNMDLWTFFNKEGIELIKL